MRKIYCILLLGILAFNWFGYSLFISYIEYQANARLEARVNAEKYDASQLVEIKIPMEGLPYYSNSAAYERKDGSLEIEGMELNFVKERIHNDSLEILCIANNSALLLLNAKNDYFKQTNDLQNNNGKGNGANSGVAKFFPLGQYTIHENFEVASICGQKLKRQYPYCFALPFHYSAIIENPPEAC